MADNRTFTVRSNAKRAAERAIATGAAPSIDYGIRALDDGRFEIVWKTRESPTTSETETEVETASAEADQPAMTPDEALDSICGDGTAAVMARVVETAPRRSAAKKALRQRARATAELPPGTTPEKPAVPDTFASYRKRFDRLEELAAAGDWAAVAAYEVKGKNTYSKKLIRYRDQLVAAHAAQPAAASGGETLVEGCERYLASCGL